MDISYLPIVIGVAAPVAIVVGIVLWTRMRRTSRSDMETLGEVDAALDELLPPLRFLADLDRVWPELDASQRREIEDSYAYRNRHHEKQAEDAVQRLVTLTRQIRALKHRRLRADLEQFLKDWRRQEPDQVKVFQALIRTARDGNPGAGDALHQS